MAILNPSIEVIKRQKVKPTEGELTLLNYLVANLDNSIEIFFQPFLNGDFPDIILMKRGYGVLIIEVKDWNLQSYRLDKNGSWHIQKDDTKIQSPFKQVREYKYNLFTLHSEELFNQQISNPNLWNIVKCAVYFHNATEKDLSKFLFDGVVDSKYDEFINGYFYFGNDSLNKNKLNEMLIWSSLNNQNNHFDSDIYNSFYRYFQAPLHKIEEGININYTKEQQELIRSEVRPRRKVKGVAGSGKTLVLAKRAVNAHKRTGSRVLILTYNISLKNYIRDRISDVREEFYWNNFYITNYHQFFKNEANRYLVPIKSLQSWEDVKFFEKVKNEINKYDVVLIDEVQDYLQEWIDIIAKYFMHESTEFVVFGDEKQNIYERELDENKEPIVRTIVGVWNKSLNQTQRFSNNIGNLAVKFQRSIFQQKYNVDDLKMLSTMDFTSRVIEYHYFQTFDSKLLFNTMYKVLQSNKIHSSDVGILCSKIEILRDIDYSIRTIKHENTCIGFETHEEFEKFGNNKSKIEDIRRGRKVHFYMKTGTVKLSTIHSFKGWEIDTLFLFIEKDSSSNSTNAELIYTGITRARRNLIIFNLGNYKYDNFFKQEIENKFEHTLANKNEYKYDGGDLPF